MIHRAIFLLAVCSLGGLAVPSVFERYMKNERAGVEMVDPAPAILDASVETRTAGRSSGAFGNSVVLAADVSGHFRTAARLNGVRDDVLIDTGATKVAISASTARRIGINPGLSDWTIPVQTANGTAKAATGTIDRLDIGMISVRDVDALILEDGLLTTTLLGMSFLSELSRYSVEDERLTMER